ncbi:MAG: DUF2752 domain-containing protein [Flavobacteriales bacterium]
MYFSENTGSKKFAVLSILACLTGYCWIFGFSEAGWHLMCPFKAVTGVACPSCGSTRAAKALFSGSLYEVWSMNPLGAVVIVLVTLFATISMYDLVNGTAHAISWYRKLEGSISRKPVVGLMALLLLLNWIWSLEKGI